MELPVCCIQRACSLQCPRAAASAIAWEARCKPSPVQCKRGLPQAGAAPGAGHVLAKRARLRVRRVVLLASGSHGMASLWQVQVGPKVLCRLRW
eukprot:CAMPEP_0202363130 /NCGR_PEP_ID=MMETSP1126-20121109/15048_1 /ASSEMBLY_ACC=CAM_ASM_000457 /TAXON_ID=3047 /ORGANISM="Dunaliella tertiolecta, Strain CCMP1320" /LENGTH=93 /DNA_ID=CAMNT_0048957485 /DNA_START=765 /DNA_END=1046 /DNA_ORIENTATION=-